LQEIGGLGIKERQKYPPTRTMDLKSFQILALLGRGIFGKVVLAEAKESPRLYAMKVIEKQRLIENDEAESTAVAKRVFLQGKRERHPFIVDLQATFQTEIEVYFVMEYLSGGSLEFHMMRDSKFGVDKSE
jgi:serine/threonine protein kinase